MSHGYYYQCDYCGEFKNVVDPFISQRKMAPMGWVAVIESYDHGEANDYCSPTCVAKAYSGKESRE